MRKIIISCFSFLLLTCTLHAKYRELQVVSVKRTPEPNTVVCQIIFPKENENKRHQPVHMQLRLEGFPLGTMSSFDRAKELYNSPLGQTVHVVIDNRPYLAFNQSYEDSFDENRIYYDKIVSFELPYKLEPGEHIVRAFPARSFGERLKGTDTFDAHTFYVSDKQRSNTLGIDLTKPYLTYNEPQGTFPADKSNPILLDFFISNCELSQDGFKVRLSIDGKVDRVLTKWTPYYLYGLKPGDHRIRLELLDKSDQLVPGPFNDTTRRITIE